MGRVVVVVGVGLLYSVGGRTGRRRAGGGGGGKRLL